MTTHLPVNLSVGSVQIHQHKGLYSLNDLHEASGGEARHQPALFIRLDTTRALIAEISKSTDVQIKNSNSPDMANNNPIETVRGKYGGTYACRELVIAYAQWISAGFSLKVIRVFLHHVDTAKAALPPPPPPERTRTLSFTVPESETGQRWLLHTDRMGREIVTPLIPETVIATPGRLVTMFIKQPAGLHMTPEQHMTVIGASLLHLISPAISGAAA